MPGCGRTRAAGSWARASVRRQRPRLLLHRRRRQTRHHLRHHHRHRLQRHLRLRQTRHLRNHHLRRRHPRSRRLPNHRRLRRLPQNHRSQRRRLRRTRRPSYHCPSCQRSRFRLHRRWRLQSHCPHRRRRRPRPGLQRCCRPRRWPLQACAGHRKPCTSGFRLSREVRQRMPQRGRRCRASPQARPPRRRPARRIEHRPAHRIRPGARGRASPARENGPRTPREMEALPRAWRRRVADGRGPSASAPRPGRRAPRRRHGHLGRKARPARGAQPSKPECRTRPLAPTGRTQQRHHRTKRCSAAGRTAAKALPRAHRWRPGLLSRSGVRNDSASWAGSSTRAGTRLAGWSGPAAATAPKHPCPPAGPPIVGGIFPPVVPVRWRRGSSAAPDPPRSPARRAGWNPTRWLASEHRRTYLRNRDNNARCRGWRCGTNCRTSSCPSAWEATSSSSGLQRKTVAPWRQTAHDDPSLRRTTQTVRARILMSNHKDHCDA